MKSVNDSLWHVTSLVAVFFVFSSFGKRQAHADEFELGQEIAFYGNAQGALACVFCHQKDGMGVDARGYPKIAGLQVAYLLKQLDEFKSGKRIHPLMSDTTKALTKAELQAVAHFFATLKPLRNQRAIPEEKKKIGRDIAQYGRWGKQVPACNQCHGKRGQGLSDSFPPLAGQSESYLIKQLKAFQLGRRKNDPNKLMSSIAQRLTTQEIRSLAAFYAALPTQKTAETK